MSATCRSCHRDIVWVKVAASGKMMPIDPHPRLDGNIRMLGTRDAADNVRLVEYVPPEQTGLFANGVRFVSHFATCPHAASHRTKAPAR